MPAIIAGTAPAGGRGDDGARGIVGDAEEERPSEEEDGALESAHGWRGRLTLPATGSWFQCTVAPQHFLNFFPFPHGHGWFRPIFSGRCTGW